MNGWLVKPTLLLPLETCVLHPRERLLSGSYIHMCIYVYIYIYIYIYNYVCVHILYGDVVEDFW